MVFDPKVYRNSKDGIGSPSDTYATNHTSDWTIVALLKGIWFLLSGGIGLPSGAATAANQATGNATLTAIDGHVDGIEALITSTNTKLDTLAGYVDGLETLETVSAATVTSLASAATSAQLLAANASRKGLILNNTDANAVLVKYGTTASSTSYTVRILQNGYWEMPKPIYTGRIDVIWEADGSGSIYATEM